MFTGLIEAIGHLHFLNEEQVQVYFSSAHGQFALNQLGIGDSVAVDGVCLTVEQVFTDSFIAAVSPETIRKTTLGIEINGGRHSAEWVNLESSLRVGGKLGGHFVTGHIDGIGCLISSVATATSWEMQFNCPHSVARYIIPKGSVAVNGISLTVADCSEPGDWFTVAVIPHTYEYTNLSRLVPGNSVNLEGDILGKYVEKFTRLPPVAYKQEMSTNQLYSLAPEWKGDTIITTDFLSDHGYGK